MKLREGLLSTTKVAKNPKFQETFVRQTYQGFQPEKKLKTGV